MTERSLPIEPLYVAAHAAGLAPRGEPASPPFVRGSLPLGRRWAVARRIDASEPHAADRLRHDAAAGAEAFWIRGGAATPHDEWAALGRSAGATALILCEHGRRTAAAFAALRGAGASRVAPLADPVGELLAEGSSSDAVEATLASAAEWIGSGATDAERRALAVSASVVHEAGGHAALEIGFALASVVEMARRLEPLGVSVERSLGSIGLVVTAGIEPYEAIAKLRALRLGWTKVAVALGARDVPAPMVIGHTSRRAMALTDMPSNAIRGTVEAFALAVGGADVIVTRAFDELAAQPSDLGRRVALATQLVLRHESHLGEVADAAGGSYYLEARTDELARAGWAEMQAIETEGGVVRSIEAGAFPARVRSAGAALIADTNRRKRVIVGVSDFAAGSEPPAAPAVEPAPGGLAPIRPAEAFERVRARAGALGSGRPAEVRLVLLGSSGSWRGREDFARRFFEAGGFAVTSSSLDDALASSPAGRAFVLCGTDETYAEAAVATTKALASAGAATVVLAGKPGALDADLRAAGLGHAIHLGCDAPAVLNGVLDRLAGGAS